MADIDDIWDDDEDAEMHMIPQHLRGPISDDERAELEEAQHQEEMRALEEREMEEHFRRHPHG